MAKRSLKIAKEKQSVLRDELGRNLEQLENCIGKDKRKHFLPILKNAFDSTIIFGQEEAGTGVCIDERGYVLTCAHCVLENEDESEEISGVGIKHLVLLATGELYESECIAWDSLRDCALLQLINLIDSKDSKKRKLSSSFSFLSIAEDYPKKNSTMYCIGQPGQDDLESEEEKKTDYSFIFTSKGRFKGLVDGDPHDNREIGMLKHDCWTYWGHSGAPLLDEEGKIVGIHSSWDDQTAMRHGVPLQAIREFLRVNLPK